MDPLILLLTEGQPFVAVPGGVLTSEGFFPVPETGGIGSFSSAFSSAFDLVDVIEVELQAAIAGTSTIAAHLSGIHGLRTVIAGAGGVAAYVSGEAVAGFEIPYPLGIGGVHTAELITLVTGISGVTANLTRVQTLRATIAGTATVTSALTIFGAQVLAATPTGTSNVTAELYVNAIRTISATIAGTSTVTLSTVNMSPPAIDPRNQSHLYLAVNVGVGFDPTDIYPGTEFSQNFPDGHVRDDFWEYLVILVSVGVGFDPTDDISARPDFISQTYPDGHTITDFMEYLYLYLNVVLGTNQLGQLVIRPGFTRGPILPSSKPPHMEPS